MFFLLLLLLLGCFPVSAFAAANLWGDRQPQDELLESDTLTSCKRSDLATWMQLFLAAAIVLFVFSKGTTAAYASLAFFPLTYLGSVTIWRAVRWDVRPKVTSFLLPALGAAVGLVVMAIPYLGRGSDGFLPFFVEATFARAAFGTDVRWEFWHGAPGFILVASALGGFYFWKKNRPWLAAQTAFIGGAVFTKLTIAFIVLNIEGHSQRAAIEFFKSKRDEPCVVQPIGFKTYAHLFYACKMPDTACVKTYYVAKTGDLDSLSQIPGYRELYRKNGFVFFMREIPGGK